MLSSFFMYIYASSYPPIDPAIELVLESLIIFIFICIGGGEVKSYEHSDLLPNIFLKEFVSISSNM